MGMTYEFERHIEAARTAKNEWAVKALQAHKDLFDSLRETGVIEELPLEVRPVQVQLQLESSPKPPDLRQVTFDLLANTREPYAKERQLIEKRDGVFLPVEAKSLAQVYTENTEYFGYVNPSEVLRNYTPPLAFEVAVFPSKLKIPRSNNSTQAKQLRLTEYYSKEQIEPEFPEAKAIMLPATGLVQIDIGYQKRNNGKVLLPDFWARALDTAVGSIVASVGRSCPDLGLSVGYWGAGSGNHDVWALPAVVFLRK